MTDQTRPLWLLALSAVLSGVVLAAASILPASSNVAPDTLTELRDGGAVLLMRHAITDRSSSDVDPTARGTCAQQRNLAPEGIEQARQIGERLRELDVPVGAILASPFCRTMDTGQSIADGGGFADALPSDALLSLTAALDLEGSQAISDAASGLIQMALTEDVVTVMVTHTQNIEVLTGLTVEEGDAVVLTPQPGGPPTVLDVIPAADW